MRRHGMLPKQQTHITIGSLTLNTLTGIAYLHEEDLLLSKKEFSLLYVMIVHHGEVLSKDQLYQTAWGQPMGHDDTALTTALSRFRKQL